MYIESKATGLTGEARIGRVSFSKTGRTLYYRGRAFQSLRGAGYKANYYDIATGEEYWISGPRKDGADRLYGEPAPVEIDEDVREEYWTQIRSEPQRVKRLRRKPLRAQPIVVTARPRCAELGTFSRRPWVQLDAPTLRPPPVWCLAATSRYVEALTTPLLDPG